MSDNYECVLARRLEGEIVAFLLLKTVEGGKEDYYNGSSYLLPSNCPY